MIMKRAENIERLKGFEIPSIRNGNFIFYSRYFKNLKVIFDKYIRENDKVLDIGCGNKPFEQYIKALIKTNEKDDYIGCDIVQSSENKVDILCEATDIPVKSESFDVVVCTQVIEHVFDHQKVFDEAYRLLKPGGRFIVSSPFVWEKHEIPYDFYRFTDFCFENLLVRSGFTVKERVACGGKWAVFGQLLIQCFTRRKRMKNIFYKFFRWVWNGSITLFSNLFFNYLDYRYNKTDEFSLNYIFVGEKSE